MPAVKSLEDLKRVKEEALERRRAQASSGRTQITVGMGTCGIAAGARETMKAILEVIEKESLSDIIVAQTGCRGGNRPGAKSHLRESLPGKGQGDNARTRNGFKDHQGVSGPCLALAGLSLCSIAGVRNLLGIQK
jgi:hypothetical protein